MKVVNVKLSKIQICPNCQMEHNNDDWSGFCSKLCFFGFPVNNNKPLKK